MNLNKALSNRFVPEADGRAHSLAEHTVCKAMQLRRGLTAVIVPWLLNEAISSLSILQTV